MGQLIIRMYGTNWCGDCMRAKRFFQEQKIPYKWIDIDHDKEAEKLVIQINRGNRSVPTIILPDGGILVEPSTVELKDRILN